MFVAWQVDGIQMGAAGLAVAIWCIAAAMKPSEPPGRSPRYELAQLNIARLLAPLDSPQLSGFVSRLAEINALADAAPGFVWRFQTEEGDATSLRAFEDDWVLVNFSVWTSPEALHAFVYRTRHAEVMRHRREWFEHSDQPFVVLWWVPAGHRPTVGEAVARLEQLRREGPTPAAFTFQDRFPAPDAAEAAIAPSLPDDSPADPLRRLRAGPIPRRPAGAARARVAGAGGVDGVTMSSTTRNELLAVAAEWDRAMVQNDAEAIGKYMTDDWLIVGPDGTIGDKATFLRLVASGTLAHDVMETDDATVRVYGDAAVLLARGVSGGHYAGQPFREVERVSCVFVRDEGRWRCVLTHLSRIADTQLAGGS
jgi:ketosteroid isomerase-like protein